MTNMDVSLRLRLENHLSREAKVAERDLKELGDAARKLGTGRSNQLGRDIAQIRTEANRSESALSKLDKSARQLNSINTNAAEREINSLGTAAVQAREKIHSVGTRLRNIAREDGGKLDQLGGRFDRLDKPASSLNSTMGLLAASAHGAFAGLMAFASVDNVIRGLEQMSDKFRELNRDVMDVAITLEMATPEAVAKITSSNERLGIRYGRNLSEVNETRKQYAASGIGLDSQEAILDPTLKAAMTYKTPGETIASALIAAKQNLKVKDSEVPMAIDMMAKGAKLGNFEVGAMAKNFPALGAYMAGTGRTGLDGWAELIAMSQIARTTSGSEDEAANNLRNWLSKLSARETTDNFKKKGVNLEKLKAKAQKDGKSYPLAVMDEVMRVTGGNEFRINELFADQQAYQALKPLLDNRAKFDEFLNDILNNSKGGLDADAKAAAKTPYEKAARRSAAVEATGAKVGEAYDRAVSPWYDRIVRMINPEYDRQRTIEDEPELLKQSSGERLRVENEILRLQGQQREMGDGGQALGPQINRLKAQLQTLVEEEAAIVENARKAAEADQPVSSGNDGDLGKTTGEIPLPGARPGPVPIGRPIEQKLGSDMSGSAEKAMQGYNERLAIEGDRAVSIAAEKAAAMQKLLNFTAQPTIAPTFLPPSGPPAGVAPPTGTPGKQSSLQNNTGVKLTQNISSPNSRVAALRAQREANRSVRMAQARALGDLGPRTA
ncbi:MULTISPECIES: phage tail tape measure protein [Rhizobium]|uniref:phage tail tape measure protein n=1 Tax=Rhizobium TaxID=379 RepID=UPI00140B5D4C|nr:MULTISPECIES: phage tail tape measure protein [Rhizobium]MDG3574755.1 phage tail tape measure protein [Rhizobium sp. YJ-22]